MGERDPIDAVDAPATTASLCQDLRALGLRAGDVVIVHSSLSSMGWVVGGAVAVVDALMEVVTRDGTLVMPTHSSQNSEPSYWENPPIPKEWWQPFRDNAPAFDPDTTPTRGMGTIPEVFRTYRGTRRSYHPTDSFAAWGADRDQIVDDHELDFGLGGGGPLGRLYELDARVLLLGVGHDRNTSLHLAEHRWGGAETTTMGGAVRFEQDREWVEWDDFDLVIDDFKACGKAFERKAKGAVVGKVAAAEARLMSQPALVDFAVAWFSENREFA